jgi:hypothetical protein
MYSAYTKELTKAEILKRVSEWDLWSYYIPGVKLGGSFLSPLRREKEPSASLFVSRSGNILLKDFKLGTFTIWRFLQEKYNLTYHECLLTINNDFDLGITLRRNNKPTMSYFGIEQKEKPEQKSSLTELAIKRRSWNTFDKNYWLQYNIPVDFIETRNHKVIPLDNFWINGELSYWHYEYNPAYSYEFGNKLRKIYMPYNKKLRFVMNCKEDIIQGEDDLPWTGDILFITKSYKDVLFLSTLGYNAISPQSESYTLSEEVIARYEKRFENIYLLYDNDEVGIKYSNNNCIKYPCLKQIFVPKESECKDISDFYKKYKKIETLKLIEKWMSLIN